MAIKSLLRQRNRYHDRYSHFSEVSTLIGTRLLERLELVKIQPKRILEIGSADGTLTTLLEKQYKKVDIIGIEPSPKLAKRALKQKTWRSRQRFASSQAEKLPLEDNSIDLVISNLFPVWSNDLGSFFSEIQRVLTQQGLLLFSSLGPDSLTEIRNAWHSVDPDFPHQQNFVDMHDVGDALSQNGFQGIVMESEPLNVEYESPKQLHNDLKYTAQASLHPQRRKTLLGKQRFQRYCQALTQSPVGIQCHLEIIYGHGWVGYQKPKMAIHDQRPDGAQIPTKVQF